ncbi:MAG: DUF5786 family protein [Halobacteria archaeon]|nr:DUF5786 family protein [Halobacteria archaeon]
MGSYDESEQQKHEGKVDENVGENDQITTESYDGDVSYETPEADELLERFKNDVQDEE